MTVRLVAGCSTAEFPAHIYALDLGPNVWRCVLHEPHSDECPFGELEDEWMPL